MTPPRCKNILSLPNDILLEILDYLEYFDLLRLTLLCKRFNSIISSCISHYTHNPFSKTSLCETLFLTASPVHYLEQSLQARLNGETSIIDNINIHPVLSKYRFNTEFSNWSNTGVYVSYSIGPHTFLTTPATIPFHEAITTLEARNHPLPKVLYQNATFPSTKELYLSSEFHCSKAVRVDGTRPIYTCRNYDQSKYEERSVMVIDVLEVAYRLVWEMGGSGPLRRQESIHKVSTHWVNVLLDEDGVQGMLFNLGVKTLHRPAEEALKRWRSEGGDIFLHQE